MNSLDQAREREVRERLRACENAWRLGNFPALVDAIEDCIKFKCPPPPWVMHAVATLVARQMLVKTGRGAFNSRQARFEENLKHYARWDMVNELQERGREFYERWEFHRKMGYPVDGMIKDEGLTKEAACKRASEELEGTAAAGSEETIRRSYNLVENSAKQGRGGEFYLTRFRPNGKR